MSRLVEVAVPLPLQDVYAYAVPEALAETVGLGARVLVPFGKRKLVGYVVGFPESASVSKLREIERLLDDPPLLTAKLVELSNWIASYYACSFGEALRAALPSAISRTRRSPRRADPVEPTAPSALLEPVLPERLNTWQSQALARIQQRFDQGGFEAFLLHGVTGSGKTEVYLHAIRSALEKGRASILLIPEIALTPQAADRFRSRLGTEVGILHSGMTPAERHDVLVAASRGDIQVVLGARSAVFAPFRNLGLIVVDEEHEASYKQGEKPRYHARSVALVRGQMEGAAVLLGSATPSLESYHNALQGKHELLRIPERVDGRPLPRVHLVDMREDENRGAVISSVLQEALADRLARREQSIVLLNRRGHSNYVQCLGCGGIVRCTLCDISLTYHAPEKRLRCHYCNQSRVVPEKCGDCQSPCQVFRGMGTQRLEQTLVGLLPEARVSRMDFDTTARRGAHRRILEEFARGDIDVLLGTQMVAKGHDFPAVTLVGVVCADGGLSLPDLRASERTFQLLAQVAGRAGRGEKPGDVFVQTMCPDHYSMALVAKQDFPGFYDRESQLRESLGYPPFARLTGITGLGRDVVRLGDSMQRVADRVRKTASMARVQVLGPAESPLPRLRGRYREQILLKGSLSRQAKDELRELLAEESRSTRGVEFQLDIDPIQLL